MFIYKILNAFYAVMVFRLKLCKNFVYGFQNLVLTLCNADSVYVDCGFVIFAFTALIVEGGTL